MTTEATFSAPPADAYEQMSRLVTGHWIPQVIRAAIGLGVPEHLADAALTAGELADRAGSAPGTTFRLLRACVAIGLVTADDDGRFRGTPLLRTLHRDTPGSLRGLALATTLPGQWLAWNAFTASVRKGETQVAQALGTDFFSYLEEHPDEARDFSRGLASTTALWTSAAAQVIDTAGVGLAVDVGGSDGALLHLLLEANPDLRGIVFDRPNVVPDAIEAAEKRGLADRTEVIGGDFFAGVPAADLYLVKMIMHDWDDDGCVTILRNIRTAMNPGARVAVVEMLVGNPSDPGPAALMDMNMLAVVPGQERSLAEYDALLSAAGLRRTTVTSTGSGQSVIESVAALTP
ncbi:MAG TPA: methyltransferase [Trebonia sp.]